VASQGVAVGGAGWTQRGSDAAVGWEAPDARRWLQLGLAALWLLDGVLQYQSAMFTRAFSQMLGGTAAGNPAVIADPISWAARIIEHNPTTTNVAFASIQLALGLGIAWRRSVRLALAGSIVWSVAVWWLGEGLGGVLTGGASPVNGAPGAVVLYALLAVLLWPAAGGRASGNGTGRGRASGIGAGRGRAGGGRAGGFVAARPLGARAARAVWLALWGSLACFAVLAANRTAQGLHDMIAGLAAGEPGWLASVNRGAASLVAHRGLAASVVLAVVLFAIAAGIFLPAPAVRVTVVLAVVVSAAIWVVGQDLGTILARGATDVNSGPLLMLVALAYWPVRAGRAAPGDGLAVPAADLAVPAGGTSAAGVSEGTTR
jgi:hypothetical protein